MNDYKQIKIEFSNETQSFIESFIKNADYFKNNAIFLYLSNETSSSRWRHIYAKKQAELNGRLDKFEKFGDSSFMRNNDKIHIKPFDNSLNLLQENSFILHFSHKNKHHFDLPPDVWVYGGLYHFPKSSQTTSYNETYDDEQGLTQKIIYGLPLQKINGLKLKDIHYNHDKWSNAVNNYHNQHSGENNEEIPQRFVINLGDFIENHLAKFIE